MSDRTEKNDEELSLKLFVVLSRAIESVKKQVVKDIKSYQLNLTEFGVMEFLYHKGEQPIQLIGKKVLLASSSITYVVDKLESKNLVRRKPCPKDRRITYATLTQQGRDLMDEIFPKHKEAIMEIFSGLNSAEKEKLIDQLKQLGYHAQNL